MHFLRDRRFAQNFKHIKHFYYSTNSVRWKKIRQTKKFLGFELRLSVQPTSCFLICQTKGGAGGEPGTPPLLRIYEWHQDDFPETQSSAKLPHPLHNPVPPDASHNLSHPSCNRTEACGGISGEGHPWASSQTSKQGECVCVCVCADNLRGSREEVMLGEVSPAPSLSFSPLRPYATETRHINILYPEAICRV